MPTDTSVREMPAYNRSALVRQRTDSLRWDKTLRERPHLFLKTHEVIGCGARKRPLTGRLHNPDKEQSTLLKA